MRVHVFLFKQIDLIYEKLIQKPAQNYKETMRTGRDSNVFN